MESDKISAAVLNYSPVGAPCFEIGCLMEHHGPPPRGAMMESKMWHLNNQPESYFNKYFMRGPICIFIHAFCFCGCFSWSVLSLFPSVFSNLFSPGLLCGKQTMKMHLVGGPHRGSHIINCQRNKRLV